MVAAEAVARGIPVVASRVGGVPEAIAGSTAAILVPPDDPVALRAVIRQWWAEPPRRAVLKAEAVRSRARRRTWAESARIAATVLGRPRPAAGAVESERRRAG